MIYYFVRKFVTYVRYLGTKQGCYKVCFLVLHNNGFYMDAEVNWLKRPDPKIKAKPCINYRIKSPA